MRTLEQTRAELAAREARVMADFDALDAYIANVTGRMRADGVLPDRRRAPRNGALDGLGYAPGSEPKPEVAA